MGEESRERGLFLSSDVTELSDGVLQTVKFPRSEEANGESFSILVNITHNTKITLQEKYITEFINNYRPDIDIIEKLKYKYKMGNIKYKYESHHRQYNKYIKHNPIEYKHT